MSRRKAHFGSQDWLIIVAIASPWLIGLAAFGAHALADMLPHLDTTRQTKPEFFRAWMELFSFAGSFGLFATAMIAGWITLRQLRDARATRVAAIYIEVNKTYTSDLMRQSRTEILRVKQDFETGGGPDLAAYMADQMMHWKLASIDSDEYKRFNDCIRMLNFWEDVGVLVGWDFIDPDVILDFHRSGLRLAHERFHVYIERARQADEMKQRQQQPNYQTRLYDNALQLIQAALR